ncbi:MAG: HIT domain-containing protein [Chloroflexi bacterium]|nr:HIT domain-containing protein [Chloroflexota bacterium]
MNEQKRFCIFCEIVAGRSPAMLRYEDDETMVFDNLLRWAPVMLLAVPKRHLTQQELWSEGTIAKIGAVAVEVGRRFCPDGFRLLSNFGWHAMQSQEHGHLHIIGGGHLGPYV